MSKAISDVIENTKEIFMTDSALDSLMDFERVLDELDLYVFAHWKEGELVEGPVYEKYFVTCTFMWPYKLMPDPRGGERLLDYDCEVYYSKDTLEYPIKVKTPDDFVPGTKMPKMKKVPVWLVKIVMPKKLMQEIQQGSLELEGANLDLEDIEQAYEEGDDQAQFDQNEQNQEQQQNVQQQPAQPQF
jgi:hypothetical protein